MSAQGRLAAAFARAREQRRAALVAYVCGGDPTLEATERLVPELARDGADVIELGLPFSDPVADGPAIQAASQRALAAGASTTRVLELVGRVRDAGLETPIVLMGYLNPLLAMGIERFADRAQRAGLDAVIVPDLPLEEAGPVSGALAERGLNLVLLAAPTTPPARLGRIARQTRGFLYFVSATGVTGGEAALPAELPEQLDRARGFSPVPVACGFGISTPEQARAVARHADAVIVGSALVRELERARGEPGPVGERVRQLAGALGR